MSASIARRMVVGLQGPVLLPEEAAWLGAHRPAGVILFGRNVTDKEQLQRLCAQVRRQAPACTVCADHEGGAVSQLAAALGRPPAAWGLGVLDDPDLTHRVHRETGLRLAAVGIDRILGPVADVLCERRNPVIGARAFGADTDLVARHVCAAVAGLRDAGLRVCVKHWPGHGGTLVDSHLGLPGRPAVDADAAALAEAPFLAAVAAGADGLMIGHLPVPKAMGKAAPGTADLPATLNARAQTDLRRRLATGGAGGAATPQLRLFADDVTMGALRPGMRARGVPDPDGQIGGLVAPEALPAAWLEALAATGCDFLLCRGIPWRALPLPPAGAGRETAADPGRERPWVLPEAPGYREARRRLALRNLPADFGDPSADLLWLDTSAQDRWQAAAGLADGGAAALAAALRARFRAVRTPADWTAGATVTRLLVTSHRPWSAQGLFPGAVGADPAGHPAGPLAEQGVCLVMGHPSLAEDVAGFLPPRWRVGALFDVCAQDLDG